jgi:hypothetical protein
MHFFRKRKSQPAELLDYRELSNRVHERRTEREREPGVYRENPEEAERAVRTYRPEQRLRAVDAGVRQLKKDSRGIPRIWDPEWKVPWRSYWIEAAVFFFFQPMALLGVCDAIKGRAEPDHLLIVTGFILVGTLVGVTVLLRNKLGSLLWVGLSVALIEFGFLLRSVFGAHN